MEKELQNQTYQPGRSICFVIKEPKIREVWAADFRDRVVHHLVYNYLEPVWEKKFIYHSYSCRPNKGTHLAIKRLKNLIRGNKNLYYFKVDIKSFFTSIDKPILFKLITRRPLPSELSWLAKVIIFHNPQENFTIKGEKSLLKRVPLYKSLFYIPRTKGLPIGNLTSQFFANIYLNELDQYVKHELKCLYYFRYVDDILLLSENPKKLLYWKEQIDNFLQAHLKLKLNPRKQTLQPATKGINFIGYIVKPHYILVRRSTVNNLKRKLKEFNKLILITPPTKEILDSMLATVNSYYGFFKHANTYNLRKHLYQRNFGVLKNYLLAKDKNFFSFKLAPHLSQNSDTQELYNQRGGHSEHS